MLFSHCRAHNIALCDRGKKRRQAALYKWYRKINKKKTHTKYLRKWFEGTKRIEGWRMDCKEF